MENGLIGERDGVQRDLVVLIHAAEIWLIGKMIIQRVKGMLALIVK